MADFNFITRGGEQRLLINNGQVGIKIKDTDIGNWNHIRIGFRGAVNGENTAAYYGAPPFIFGMCSGINNMYFSTTTSHFIGFTTRDDGGNWSNNGLVYYHSIASSYLRFLKKINNIITTYSHSGNSSDFCLYKTISSAGVEQTSCSSYLIDFIKSEQNLQMTLYYPYTYNVTSAMFTNSMNNPIVPSQYYNYSRTGTISDFDELTNGYLDTINVGWQSLDFNLEINDLSYSIFR